MASDTRRGRGVAAAVAAVLLAAGGGQPVMQAVAARALFGEAGFSGRLPVTIPGVAARGYGIQRPAVR